MSDTDETQTAPTATQDQNQLPDWVRKQITEANNEAAKYRVKAQNTAAEVRAELETKFQDDLKVMSDEKSAALSERDSAVAEANRLRAALRAGIPGESAEEFSKLLQGKDLDEYVAHAESLKAMFGTNTRVRATDPTQGLNGGSGDPEDAFQQLFTSKLKR